MVDLVAGRTDDNASVPLRVDADGTVVVRSDVSAEGGALYSDDGELWTTNTERENNVRASFVQTGIQASSWAILIDLSDTVNFPHDETGAAHVSLISLQVDRGNTSVGLVQVGVVTRVDGINGDVTSFAAVRFENGSPTNVIRDINFAPSQVKCGVVAGATTHMVSNSKLLNDTGLQTDIAIPTATGGTAFPAVGDVVVKYTHTSGSAWTGGVGVLYHSHA